MQKRLTIDEYNSLMAGREELESQRDALADFLYDRNRDLKDIAELEGSTEEFRPTWDR
jgi:hypothetical protein